MSSNPSWLPLDRGTTRFNAVDTSVAFRVRYIGSEASGIIDIANTSGDITLKHGAASSEVADTTVNPAGATAGTIDLADEATTFKAALDIINGSANWEAYPVGALPGDDLFATTCKIVNNVAGGDCTTALGYACVFDTSVVFYASVGVTYNGPNSGPHNHDGGAYHEITKIAATSTYASGTSTINVYQVDDHAGTSTLVSSTAGGATTVAQTVGDGSYAVLNTRGHRLVVKLTNSAAMSAVDLDVWYGSKKYHPGVRSKHLYSDYM